VRDLRLANAAAKAAFVLLFALGLIVAACGSGPAPTAVVQSPTAAGSPSPGPTVADPTLAALSPADTAEAFFSALNNRNLELAASYLEPDRRGVWLGAELPPRDEFQNVRCRPASESGWPQVLDTLTKAVVACTYYVREDWGGFQRGPQESRAWGLWLRRELSGPWLIADWGVPISSW
jgi:hypothetical protein